MCLVVKFKPQTPEYKEIQIVLESTPVVERSVEEQAMSDMQQSAVPEPVEGQAPELPNPVETPVAEAKVEAPKKAPAPAKPKTSTQPKTQTATKTTPAKKETPADKKVSYELVKSVEEQMAEQMSTKKQSTVPDWWDDDTPVTEQQTEVSKIPEKVTAQSGMEGTAGTKTNQNTQERSSSMTGKNSDETPGKEVEDARDRILNATGSNNSTGASSQDTISSSKNQNFEFSWEGSGKRTQSSSLSIDLGSNTIESTRTVTITIKVLESGYVDRGSIEIDVASLLTKEIRESIYDSISKWHFNSSNEVSRATFKYTIKKQ